MSAPRSFHFILFIAFGDDFYLQCFIVRKRERVDSPLIGSDESTYCLRMYVATVLHMMLCFSFSGFLHVALWGLVVTCALLSSSVGLY